MSAACGWRQVEDVALVALDHRGRLRWWMAFAGAGAATLLLVAMVLHLLLRGVGVWGNDNAVVWALDIVGYDWWIGIATGSLALSAVLLLTGVAWRGPVNRVAETVALLAVAAAGLYPILHLGRPWFFFWTLPYPNTYLLWPQLRSPLFWDAIDILCCLSIALLLWFTGLLPDLACLRDRAVERALAQPDGPAGAMRRLRAHLYGIAALGWHGSVVHWRRWTDAYRLIAAASLVLVASLQTGAAVMFAGTVQPGWHDGLLPLTDLMGATLAGVAATSFVLALLRWLLPLGGLVERAHLARLAGLMLALGLAVGWCNGASAMVGVLHGTAFERAVLARRFAGPDGWSGWLAMGGQVLAPQLFWLGGARRSGLAVGLVAGCVAAGSWADRFMLIVVTLRHGFLPQAGHYRIGWEAAGLFVGTAGLFTLLMLLCMRFLPVLSMSALRAPGLAVPAGADPVGALRVGDARGDG